MSELTYSFQEQLDLHIKDPKEFDNIYPHSDWTLEDYKAMFEWISARHLVQQEGGIGFVYEDRGDEPCDWCGTHQMSWCQSNGCPPESEDEEEEVDSFVYNSYKCKHSDCDYETLNTNPDCIKCGKECCMLAQSNQGSIEYEIECCYEAEHGAGISNSFRSKEEAMEEFERFTNYDKEDQYYVVYLNERLLDKGGDLYSSDEIKVWRKEEEEEEELVWCEVGEHHVDKDEMWPDFGDCQNCCSEKEYLERTGGTKTKKIKFNVKNN